MPVRVRPPAPAFGRARQIDSDPNSPYLNSFTHAYPDVTNGRFEAALESKVKNAKQIVLYALAFLCFSQKPSGEIFDLFRFCVSPCFLNVGVIKSMSDCYSHFLPSNWVKTDKHGCQNGPRAKRGLGLR